MQATGTQGMCTRACVPAERVEAGLGRSTLWNGRRRALGAPLSGLRMGHGGLCRTGAGSRSRRRVAMPRLPIAGGLAGTTRPTAASDGMAGGRPGRESPNPHLCAKIGGGESRSTDSPLPFPGRVRPAGSGGGRSAGRQATTPAAEGRHRRGAHVRPPGTGWPPGLAMPGRGDGRAPGAPAHNQGRILAAGAAGSASGMGFVVKAGHRPAFFFFCCRDRFPPQGGWPCLRLSDGLETGPVVKECRD